jgi:hypothetical protein
MSPGETEREEFLTLLIAHALSRRTVALHFTRGHRPGIVVGRVDGCDSRMVFAPCVRIDVHPLRERSRRQLTTVGRKQASDGYV